MSLEISSWDKSRVLKRAPIILKQSQARLYFLSDAPDTAGVDHKTPASHRFWVLQAFVLTDEEGLYKKHYKIVITYCSLVISLHMPVLCDLDHFFRCLLFFLQIKI